jgi:cysteinyl-tRNA synthetase
MTRLARRKTSLQEGEISKKQLKIYNSLRKRKERFVPLESGKVRMYTCGLTVNYLMHIGHARTYVFWDIVERFLRYLDYEVIHVSNVTDISVDDNILKRAKANDQAFQQLVTRHTQDYYHDRRLLGIADPFTYAVATQHIQEMIELVQRLIDRGVAYEAEDGVYFRITTFPNYGQLSGINPSALQAGAGGRIDKDEYDKDSIGDFVLWKRAKPGEPFWYSPWGPGRPGWHIECSAMSAKYLGHTLDISGGGEDNIFPHHENSIAQSEAAHGTTYVRYWMHVRHLQLDGEKMSKSTGNFLTVREALNQYSAAALRLFLLTTHYRKPLRFKDTEIQRSQKLLDRLRQVLTRLQASNERRGNPSQAEKQIVASLQEARQSFESALLDDFNTGRSINHLFQWVNSVHTFFETHNEITNETTREMLAFFEAVGTILFGDLYTREVLSKPDPIITRLVELLLQQREQYRHEQQYEEADKIRTILSKLGFEITDTKSGTQWWTKSKP